MNRPAAFLDRDGVLNVRREPHQYVRSMNEFKWLPGAPEGAAALAHAGYLLAVISNQRGVALGLVDPAVLTEIEAEVQATLCRHGARIEAFRYCVHDSDAGCDCRKPAPGMLLSLAQELELDLSRSWMIGDSESDVEAGHAAGCATALLGEPGITAPMHKPPELVAGSLLAASQLIVSRALPDLRSEARPR